MLDARMEAALNKQVNAELYSAYLYVSMSAHFQAENLPGLANWMSKQAQEEMFHASKFYKFIQDRGGKVLLQAIDGPPTSWETPSELFEAVLEHERHVTSLIHGLYGLSEELKDYPTRVFLHWFVNEQVEEEASAEEWLLKVQRVENSPSGMFQVDREAAARVFDLAAALAGTKE